MYKVSSFLIGIFSKFCGTLAIVVLQSALLTCHWKRDVNKRTLNYTNTLLPTLPKSSRHLWSVGRRKRGLIIPRKDFYLKLECEVTSVASCVAGVFGRVSNVAVVDRYWYVRLLGLFSPFNRALLGLSSPFNRALLGLSSPFNRALLCLSSPVNRALLGLFSPFNRALLGLFSPFNRALLYLSSPFNRALLCLSVLSTGHCYVCPVLSTGHC